MWTIRWIHGVKNIGRITGTEFVGILSSVVAATKKRLFILGGRPGVAERAKANLEKKFSGMTVCGVHDGYTDLTQAVNYINACAPDVLMVCLGNPLQEKWILDNSSQLNVRLIFGNGGAIDFWSDDVPFAPHWVKAIGCEWLFRLVTNPSLNRLKRQLGLFKYIYLVLREKRNKSLW